MDDNSLAKLSVLTSLNKMMRGNYFDICCINESIKALNTIPDEAAMKILRPLHCVPWSDMPHELRTSIPSLIERCLGIPAYQFKLTSLQMVEKDPKAGGPLKLLGVK